jgi:AcrR family transcriptional regulator
MDDLALEMGMSKKTLYVHFPGKTALLEAVLRDKLARAESDLQRASAEGDFVRRVQAMLACLREHGQELQPPFVRDMKREAPELFAVVQDGRAHLIQRYFGDLFIAGQKAGRIRNDVSAAFLVEMLIGAVNAIIHPERLGKLRLTPKAAFVKVIGVFLEGVATQKGRASK